MITYVNSENARKYSVLFNKASEALNAQYLQQHGIEPDGENRIEISSLAEYFENIKSLVDIDRKYTILPVDEDVFYIDANARSIEVPADFKKNGVGVQGDEIAEILYFKIARYFDATDLNETEIYIQWEAKDGTKGLSKEWVRDVESEPGYIIFGWPICSDITKEAGDVKFAVRFYKILSTNTGDKFLAYSFGTLTQSVNIKPSLDFNILLDADELNLIEHNHNAFIQSRMVNSNPANSYAQPAEEPVYTVNLSGHSYNGDDAEAIVDEDEVWQNLVDGHLMLHVQAMSPDAGVITYKWYKVGDLNTDLAGADDYIAVPEPEEDASRALDANKTYYTGIKSRPDLEEPDVFMFFAGDEYPIDTVLYERVSKLDVTSTGKYYALANNRVGNSNKELASHILEIPAPEAPVLKVNENTGLTGIEIAGGDVTPTLDGGITLKAVIEPMDGDADIKPHQGELTYKWLFIGPNSENISEPDPNADPAQIVINGETLELNDSNDEGFYSVIVKNSLNGEAEESDESSLIRITKAPEEIRLVDNYLGIEGYIPGDAAHVAPARSRLEVSLQLNQPNYDEIQYQWYKATGNETDEDDTLIEGANTNAYTVGRAGGTFYCVVTNIYNGQMRTVKSQAVSVAESV